MDMEVAQAPATNAPATNADVLPHINKLGVRPMALAAYDENNIKHDKTGLTVDFNFTRDLNNAEAQSVAAYCARAFNLLGFKDPENQPVQPAVNTVRLRFDHESTPGEMRPAPKRYEHEIDRLEKVDSIGPVWVALRTIRQASYLA